MSVASLGLEAPYHVGIAVHDLDEAMRRFGEQVGALRWGTFDMEFPCTYRGAEVEAGVRAAYARAGAIYLELVQPTTGPSTARTFLDEHGEGVYHLGYWVDDIEEALRRAGALGLAVDMAIPAGEGPLAVYLDAAPTLGVHVELVSVSVREMIENMVAEAEAG